MRRDQHTDRAGTGSTRCDFLDTAVVAGLGATLPHAATVTANKTHATPQAALAQLTRSARRDDVPRGAVRTWQGATCARTSVDAPQPVVRHL
jgi:hypothetical protein